MTDFMRVIADESDRFLRAICRADAETAVPTCPEWDADDLFPTPPWYTSSMRALRTQGMQ